MGADQCKRAEKCEMDNPGSHTALPIARTGTDPAQHTKPVVVLSWTVRVEDPAPLGSA